jgi:N-methylhydantoinase A
VTTTHRGLQLIGVDTGGTFTDAVVATRDGRLAVAKALSTPGHVEDGVLDALVRAADQLGTDLGSLLGATDVLSHGTTVGLNALLTGTGARVGLLTTAGFESTLAIAKSNKIHGLSALDLNAPGRWGKPEMLVHPADIAGVRGRIDAAGDIVEELDEEHARAAITALLRRGVESLAVCLMWSPANPEHEQRVAAIAAELAPRMRVTMSGALASRIGEYERMTTAVIDAYVAPLVGEYLEKLERRLRESGFGGAFVVMRMGGGVQPVELARRHPIHTLRSGPAGGVVAAQQLGARNGFENVIATDVGGTSFDVGLVIAGEPQYARRPTIERLPVAARAVDIESIGTGGGSIAWIDTALGSLRVGPQTAAAEPGPACYGFGGTRATLTDAAVVLGYVERLGTTPLDTAAAAEAISREIAHPLGMTTEQAAEGIVRVACEQMRDLIRRSTIQRGHDPSEFVLLAYGGAGPQYAARFCSELGVGAVIIPAMAAGLSAYGALSGDLRVRAERDLRPVPLAGAGELVEQIFAALEPEVREQLSRADHNETDHSNADQDDRLQLTRSVGLRFYRQLHRIDVTVQSGTSTEDLIALFHARYEHVVGKGTAPADTPVELVGLAVEAQLPTAVPAPLPRGTRPGAATRTTSAVFDGVRQSCPVFAWDELGAGQRIDGPAFVQSATTTAIVPPGCAVTVSPVGDLFLELGQL